MGAGKRKRVEKGKTGDREEGRRRVKKLARSWREEERRRK